MSSYLLYIDLYLFLSFCQSKFTAISFNVLLFISIHPSSIYLYLFLSFVQSTFTPISFNPVFFIFDYSSYIHQYLFLSLVYPPLFFHTSLSMQTHSYLLQSCSLYLCLFFVYPPIFVSISCLSTSISLYLFVNPD